ncbi:TipAS antibiotic-recognition domain-containing protein (plasmid) [Pseudoalteromonas sp. T1lg65]|uniref:TipAS antibiotic-recognition domain-containing protein n=1 Tax=Pseudoalteromonas sp. T1lg65 TaxID=2077101 RepID=UPI003F78E149
MNNLSKEYVSECRKALEEEQAYSLSNTNNWSHVNRELVHQDWDILYKKLAEYVGKLTVANDSVQSLIKEHFEIACRFYTPSKKAYIGMGFFYKENKEMEKFHNSYHPEMVDYLGNAIVHYAKNNL